MHLHVQLSLISWWWLRCRHQWLLTGNAFSIHSFDVNVLLIGIYARICSYYETWHFGPRMCEIYAMLGSLFGCASIWTMTMIAFDRYNVIVKGLSAKPLTSGGAVLRIAFIWAFALFWTLAPFFGWNRYVPEGNMTACGTDYLSKDWKSRSYILVYSFFVYTSPLLLIIYSYFFIVQVCVKSIRLPLHIHNWFDR